MSGLSLPPCLCVCLYLSVHGSVCLSVCLPTSVSVCVSVSLSLYVRLSVCLSLSLFLSQWPHIDPSIDHVFCILFPSISSLSTRSCHNNTLCRRPQDVASSVHHHRTMAFRPEAVVMATEAADNAAFHR